MPPVQILFTLFPPVQILLEQKVTKDTERRSGWNGENLGTRQGSCVVGLRGSITLVL